MTEFGKFANGRYEHIRTLSQAAMLKCPHVIMMAEHYREDESCRCDDPEHREMAEWGYTWDTNAGRWT